MREKTPHRIYVNDDGVVVPSVTTVLKVLNKPQLVPWANYLGFKRINVKNELERTEIIGTTVHELIEEYSKSRVLHLTKLDDLNYDSYDSIKKCFNSFKIWNKMNNVKILHSELPLVDDNYGGTMDCVCKIKDKIYLVDFKTSNKVHPSMFIQLSAYVKLLESKGIHIDKAGILRLDKKKQNVFDFVTMKNDKNLDKYFNIFLKLLEIYNEWNELLQNDWNSKSMIG